MKKIKDMFEVKDLLIIGGMGSFFYGVYQIYPPAAYILGGIILIYLGWPKGGES